MRDALAGSPGGVVRIRVSEAPAEGGDIMGGVIVAWAVAAAAAVLAAGLAGYGIAARISRPVVALARASERMAGGDLATRAEIGGAGELGRLAGSFNLMAGRIETTVGALQRFVSDAAHELGTPLTALRADLELARDGAESEEERRQLIDRALGHEKRLEDLGDGLLRLSRLESGRAATAREPVDLSALARSSADAFASRAEQADVELAVTAPEPGPRTIADPAQLGVAVGNLLDNALKFTPAGGHVRMEVAEVAGWAVLSVADDGRGIAPSEQERVFERFHRGRDVADRPGSGLGLAIVRAAAQSCGGTARLAPAERGTRVELRLPLAPAH